MESGSGNGQLVAKLQGEIARLKEENQKLRASNRRWMRIAGTDSLTGLPNKVFFTTVLLPQAIAQATADGQPVGGIMVAPDNLGEYNKKFGRSGGNEVVKGVAAFLEENAEEGEKLVHIDGANFVVIVTNADLTKTKRRALTLRARILNRQFECAGTSVPLTLSLGVVSRAPGDPGGKLDTKALVEEFLRRMEAALDKAKQMGGDRPAEDPEVEF
ncbi:MAG: GGDEF domain-containing protein [Gemmatimonadota bacterium]